MFARLTFFAALAFAPMAAAQDAEPPASAEEIAAARARADRLIAAGEAGPYFENITDSGSPQVRHRGSGMVCSFSDEAYDRITIFPASPGLAKGDDVSCNTRLMDVDFSTYATRYARQFSEEAVVRDSLRAIAQRWPDGRPHDGDLMSASIDGSPRPLVGGYDIVVEGRPMLTLVLVAHREDWSFKGRVTGPVGEGSSPTNLLGAVMFLQALPEGQTKP